MVNGIFQYSFQFSAFHFPLKPLRGNPPFPLQKTYRTLNYILVKMITFLCFSLGDLRKNECKGTAMKINLFNPFCDIPAIILCLYIDTSFITLRYILFCLLVSDLEYLFFYFSILSYLYISIFFFIFFSILITHLHINN